MKRIALLLTLIAAILAAPISAEDGLRDVCPNIAGDQEDIPAGYELKWSNRYDAYICVQQHN